MILVGEAENEAFLKTVSSKPDSGIGRVGVHENPGDPEYLEYFNLT